MPSDAAAKASGKSPSEITEIYAYFSCNFKKIFLFYFSCGPFSGSYGLSGATQWTAPAPTADAERTPGAVMAQFYVGSDAAAATDGYQNPWTGNTTYWNAQNTTFAYTGQMWMEGGTTYTFGKSLDDGARIEIDGTTVMENNSWNSWVTASYTPSYTGWHDVDIRVSDGNGGKGPCSSANGTWGTNYGLGWNTLGLTAANSALENWRWFL